MIPKIIHILQQNRVVLHRTYIRTMLTKMIKEIMVCVDHRHRLTSRYYTYSVQIHVKKRVWGNGKFCFQLSFFI